MAPSRKKETKPKPKPTKKKAPCKKVAVPRKRKPKTPRVRAEIVWVYGIKPAKRTKYHEFHPKFQAHLEEAFKTKSQCKLYVSGRIWIIDLERMTKTINEKDEFSVFPIRRLTRAKCTETSVIGVNGVPNEKNTGYRQDDDTCIICLYKCCLPTRLPCGHVFCFMCVKSNFRMGMECPMCRTKIPAAMFQNPTRNDIDIHMSCSEEYARDVADSFRRIRLDPTTGLPVAPPSPPPPPPAGVRRSRRVTGKYYWIYESKSHGFYRYDPKTEKIIEENYIRGKAKVTIFVGGEGQEVEFRTMRQKKLMFGHLIGKRKIKRVQACDIEKYQIKGIGGISGHIRILE